LSIGDFVLSGGELGAAVVIDATARLLAGVLGNENSAVAESFGSNGMLECPQYTRPAEFRGWVVPDVLVGGNHQEIRKWRERAAAEKNGPREARFNEIGWRTRTCKTQRWRRS
jgi:tRNA (guanine37-N1)-methyltransferase